jgi:uncharacterized protein (TIGR03086 family)
MTIERTMTMGDLYVRAMGSTLRTIESVPQDRWHASTPCTEWDASQVANHIIGENLWAAELMQGKTIEQVGTALDGDLTGNDPAAAYRRSVEAAQHAVEAPNAMEATCHLSFGDYSGAEYAKQLFLDTLVHGWDIAKGTGQDTRLDPDLVDACLPLAREMMQMFRGAGVFGEDLTASAGSDPQSQLLALVGRHV